ncbi:MAG TPA: UDP-N-acetylmuramate dehydrogenase [Leptospiraceae bacterium]|nr:UDP-N-acetylmuramate dehydrogenase [Leptospiraceae bacterium]HMW06589.1 UDP-N-acetylmuramate dehydrogenase [Leptospiraceae bacterium]HMX34981.1 UDP-N-acetylmuramate dehydrogenase [Leptospiraceae bacterium]HMY31220.1 UDP-N-acetylmuramate dehydrogenase [Leptospiraceae bacterium]HMZ63293.1 UDP-N-acetylmuramate dehydrogenase [Leptospiraceae bacterium]
MRSLEETQKKEIIECLNKKKIGFRTNVNLSVLSSFKIGGISPLVVEPETKESLLDALLILKKLDLPYKILGGGSNLLISDNPNDFITLRLSGEFKEFEKVEEGKFYIGAAANTTPTFKKISLLGFTGVEFLSTIPGWVGGAVIQNAGCYGGELFNKVEFVDFLKDGVIQRKTQKEVEYGYRFTEFLKNKDSIILGIQIQVEGGNLEEIEASLKDKRDRRNSSQPENKKSAGSVFKNPNLKDENGNPIKSWQLIDRAGLRGLVKGGAQISPEHCNFIVNIGGATAADVSYLVNTIQEKVFGTSGIKLEREIEYFGTIS